MANKIRISFDTGAGWVVYSALNNNLIWGNYNDINPAIFRVRLTGGGVSFGGAEYTAILAFKDAGNNYIPILVEQDDSGWNTIFEGNADLFMPWDENKSSITLNKFNNEDDVYDNLISNYDIKYGIHTFGLTDHVINTTTITSTTVDAAKIAGTGLTPAQYIAAYSVAGFPTLLTPDPDWAFFLFRSTDAGGHNFETMSYNYPQQLFTGYGKILNPSYDPYGYIWAKLPPSIGATETIAAPVAYKFHRFPDVMGALLTIAVSTLTFTEATALTYSGLTDDDLEIQYAFFDYTVYQIGEAADVAKDGFKDSVISLKDCFDIMGSFGLYWYLDGSALKFKHQSELTTSGTLDLSTQTTDLQRLEYIEANEIPDIETWETLDYKGIAYDTGASDKWGKMQIYYRDANSVLTNTRKKEYIIPISTNVTALMSGLANTDKNNFALVETTDNSTVPRVLYGIIASEDFNSRLQGVGIFNNQVKWRYGTEADLATRLKFAVISLGNFATRPLLKIPITNYYINLLTDYDMDKAVITSAGIGRTKQITQKLDGSAAELIIEL